MDLSQRVCKRGHVGKYVQAPGNRPKCVECRRANACDRYAKNPELHIARTQDYWRRNPEVRNRISHERNPEVGKAYRAQNKDRQALAYRKYYEANKFAVMQRARLRKAFYAAGDLTQEQWNVVVDRYGKQCLACASQEALSLDHVIPLSRGGQHTEDNVQPLCLTCNKRKFTKVIDFRPDRASPTGGQ
ncbi:HNH endonuclease [Streptomyces sp. NPDC004610]|uniref:HNH endonuclease n=1 Tax=unclassified Streptomyces TaxID=2593676 RepID=UPI0033BB6B90